MSWLLQAEIINRDLPRDERCVLMALANYAQDDGSRVFPSVDKVAWDTGYTSRQAGKIIAKLLERGALVLIKKPGRRTSREFRIVLAAIPTRSPFEPVDSVKVRPEESSGLDSVKTGTLVHQGRNFSALRPEQSSPNPLSESLEESLFDDVSKKRSHPNRKKGDSRVKEYIDWFAVEYKTRFGRRYHVAWNKHSTLVKALLTTFDLPTLKRCAVALFESDDAFLSNTDRGIGILSNQINKLAGMIDQPSAQPATPAKQPPRDLLYDKEAERA